MTPEESENRYRSYCKTWLILIEHCSVQSTKKKKDVCECL
uniref:Uncharacterized protein n=1 Tax=Escherichia coli TaxID=562 RepID=A0A7U1HS19_ECOLX|nr:hypothetical protein [Escherichia coli]